MNKEGNVIIGKLTGTIGENPSVTTKRKYLDLEFGESFEPIQEMWSVNPIEENNVTKKEKD